MRVDTHRPVTRQSASSMPLDRPSDDREDADAQPAPEAAPALREVDLDECAASVMTAEGTRLEWVAHVRTEADRAKLLHLLRAPNDADVERFLSSIPELAPRAGDVAFTIGVCNALKNRKEEIRAGICASLPHDRLRPIPLKGETLAAWKASAIAPAVSGLVNAYVAASGVAPHRLKMVDIGTHGGDVLAAVSADHPQFAFDWRPAALRELMLNPVRGRRVDSMTVADLLRPDPDAPKSIPPIVHVAPDAMREAQKHWLQVRAWLDEQIGVRQGVAVLSQMDGEAMPGSLAEMYRKCSIPWSKAQDLSAVTHAYPSVARRASLRLTASSPGGFELLLQALAHLGDATVAQLRTLMAVRMDKGFAVDCHWTVTLVGSNLRASALPAPQPPPKPKPVRAPEPERAARVFDAPISWEEMSPQDALDLLDQLQEACGHGANEGMLAPLLRALNLHITHYRRLVDGKRQIEKQQEKGRLVVELPGLRMEERSVPSKKRIHPDLSVDHSRRGRADPAEDRRRRSRTRFADVLDRLPAEPVETNGHPRTAGRHAATRDEIAAALAADDPDGHARPDGQEPAPQPEPQPRPASAPAAPIAQTSVESAAAPDGLPAAPEAPSSLADRAAAVRARIARLSQPLS